MTTNTPQTAEQVLAKLRRFPMDYDGILNKLICPELKTLPQAQFLSWLIETNDYYVQQWVSKDALDKARYRLAEQQNGFKYANHDVDWRASVLRLVICEVPAIVWYTYRNYLAERDSALSDNPPRLEADG